MPNKLVDEMTLVPLRTRRKSRVNAIKGWCIRTNQKKFFGRLLMFWPSQQLWLVSRVFYFLSPKSYQNVRVENSSEIKKH